MHVLVLGTSFTGRYLAEHAGKPHRILSGLPADTVAFASVERVSFVGRDHARIGELGLRLYDPLEAASVDLILDTVPELVQGRPAFNDVVSEVLEHSGACYVHVSSTSVYPGVATGDAPFVDEGTPPDPATERAQGRLELEESIMRAYPDARLLRSAGLYGPRRALPLRFACGDFGRAAAGNRIVSRIHVADLNRLAISLAAPESPRLVNGVDECPSDNRTTFLYLEELLSIHIPGNWRTQMPEGRAVRSTFASALLLGRFLFPSFREGFADVVNHARRGGLL